MPHRDERKDLIPDTLTARALKGSSLDASLPTLAAADCKPHYTMPEPTPGGPPPNCQPGTYIVAPDPTPGGPPPNCQPARYRETKLPTTRKAQSVASLPDWATTLGDDLSETFR
jgi:hypothetical protein